MKNKVKAPKKKSILKIFIKNIFKLIDKTLVVPITKFFLMITSKFNKKTGRLEKWLVKKNTMIFISLLISLIFFFYVDSRSNVLIDSSAEVLRNQEVVATYNKEAYVVEGLPEVADVTLIGRRVDLYLAKQLSTGNVTVDISNLKPGTHKVDLNYESSINSVDYNINPSTVNVTIYPKTSLTKNADIDVVNQDYLDKKLFIQEVTIDQEEIIIKGAEHTVNKVAKVKALVDISDIAKEPDEITGGIETIENVNLVAYDSDGNVVNVEMVPNKVNATISISSSSVTVPIKVIPKKNNNNDFGLEFGKAISSISTDISQVTVYGDEDIISDINYIPVEIDVTGLSKTKTYNVVIDKPAGIRDISATTVNVTVSLGEVKEKIIDNVSIEYINLDPSYDVQSLDKNSSVTSVIVKGTEEVLKNIDASMIKATIDLAGLSKGEKSVRVVVVGEELKATYTPRTTEVNVEIFDKKN